MFSHALAVALLQALNYGFAIIGIAPFLFSKERTGGIFPFKKERRKHDFYCFCRQ